MIVTTNGTTTTVDLGDGWDLVPIVQGVPEPNWREHLPTTNTPANLAQVFQRFSGELALVRSAPLLVPGASTRDHRAEERAFATEVTPTSLYVHALGILVLLAADVLNPVHHAVARSALEKEAPDRLNQLPVVDLLARALQEAAASLLTAFRALNILGEASPADDASTVNFDDWAASDETARNRLLAAWTERQRREMANRWPVRDGMFAFDAVFAEWVEIYLREPGRDYAEEVREASRSRWAAYSQTTGFLFPEMKLYGDADLLALWVDITRGPLTDGPERGPVPARWPRGLCRELWRAIVKPKAERMPRHPPAVTAYAQTQISLFRSPGATRDALGGVEVLDASNVVIGRYLDRSDVVKVDADAVQDLLRSGIDQMPRLMVERLIRGWLIDVDQQARDGKNPFNRIEYEGGYAEVADRYGINTKDRHLLPSVLEALAQYRANDPFFPAIIGRPYRLGETRGRRAKLWIDVGAALAPGYVHKLPETIRGPARWLYPLPFTREHLLPDLSFANNRYWPALCDFQWRIIGELRARPEEATTVGVVFDEAMLQQLATATGIPKPVAVQAVAAWVKGDYPWLRKASSGRITFQSEAAVEMLRDALRIEASARRGGQAAAAKKRAVPAPFVPRRKKGKGTQQ